MGELGSQDSGFGFFNSYAAPDPASFKEECLSAAEDAARNVLNCIHPTLDSEEERRDIIDYMQRLIKSHVNSEVVNFLFFLFFLNLISFLHSWQLLCAWLIDWGRCDCDNHLLFEGLLFDYLLCVRNGGKSTFE